MTSMSLPETLAHGTITLYCTKKIVKVIKADVCGNNVNDYQQYIMRLTNAYTY